MGHFWEVAASDETDRETAASPTRSHLHGLGSKPAKNCLGKDSLPAIAAVNNRGIAAVGTLLSARTFTPGSRMHSPLKTSRKLRTVRTEESGSLSANRGSPVRNQHGFIKKK